uniref:hypothetical protein n=1 Tax=Salmonella sp. TaxID=599 RepID=UPI001CD9A29C|nr:hypothetical protein [Salmonella sp.]
MVHFPILSSISSVLFLLWLPVLRYFPSLVLFQLILFHSVHPSGVSMPGSFIEPLPAIGRFLPPLLPVLFALVFRSILVAPSFRRRSGHSPSFRSIPPGASGRIVGRDLVSGHDRYFHPGFPDRVCPGCVFRRYGAGCSAGGRHPGFHSILFPGPCFSVRFHSFVCSALMSIPLLCWPAVFRFDFSLSAAGRSSGVSGPWPVVIFMPVYPDCLDWQLNPQVAGDAALTNNQSCLCYPLELNQ